MNLLKVLLLTGLPLFFIFPSFGQAGNDRLKEIDNAMKKDADGWLRGAGIGLDFAALSLVNPRFGAGDDRLAFGGLGNVFCSYKKGRIYWNNRVSLQLAIQKVGLSSNPWQKNLDRLVLNTKAGRKFNDKWALAIEGEVETQLTPTFEGNILSAKTTEKRIANFFSPAFIRVSPGIDYLYSKNLTFFISPASLKMIYIADDSIAQQGRFGTKIDNATGRYKQSDIQLGTTIKAIYNNKYFNDKMAVNSVLDLYSNYLRNPQNVDVQWHNDISYNIWKGLALNWVVDVLYDDDIIIQKDRDGDGKLGGPTDLGKGTTLISALLLKYNLVF